MFLETLQSVTMWGVTLFVAFYILGVFHTSILLVLGAGDRGRRNRSDLNICSTQGRKYSVAHCIRWYEVV